jgi:hypothetical protein
MSKTVFKQVMVPNVKMHFCHLDEPTTNKINGKEEYGVTAVFADLDSANKFEDEVTAKIQEIVNEAGLVFSDVHIPKLVKDASENEVLKGKQYINFVAHKQPKVIDGKKHEFSETVNNGAVGNLVITLYNYDITNINKKGVSIRLTAVQVIENGEPYSTIDDMFPEF